MITIEQNVTGVRPAYNDDFFVVSSTNKTANSFQYIADIYVNGTYITREKCFPHPTTGNALFNVKRIVENYVSKDFSFDIKFATSPNSFCYYQVKFGEEFDSSTTGTTIYPDIALSSALYVWNGIYDFEDYNSFDSSLHILTSASKKFLTNAPNNLNIGSSERFYLSGMTQTSGDIYFAEIETLDINGGSIDVYQLVNPFQAVSTDAMKFFRVGCGTNDLNQLTSGDIYSSDFNTYPIIGTTVDSYTITMIKYNGTFTSETRKFFVKDVCSRTTSNRLFFLNKLGGYDAFTFKEKIKINADIKRSEYKQPQGAWTGSTAFGYNSAQRSVTQYDTNIKDSFTLISDWVTEAEAIWLEELFSSPDVFIDKSGVSVPINIVSSSYETKQTALVKLINITIEYTYSYSRYRQRF